MTREELEKAIRVNDRVYYTKFKNREAEERWVFDRKDFEDKRLLVYYKATKRNLNNKEFYNSLQPMTDEEIENIEYVRLADE
jgi:hypothetical protein